MKVLLRVASPRPWGFWRRTLTYHSDSGPFTKQGSLLNGLAWRSKRNRNLDIAQPCRGFGHYYPPATRATHTLALPMDTSLEGSEFLELPIWGVLCIYF